MSPRDETVSPTPPPPYPIYLPPPSLLPYQLVNFVCLWSVSDAAYQGDSPTQTYDGIFPESEKIYTYIRILALAREDPYPPPPVPFSSSSLYPPYLFPFPLH